MDFVLNAISSRAFLSGIQFHPCSSVSCVNQFFLEVQSTKTDFGSPAAIYRIQSVANFRYWPRIFLSRRPLELGTTCLNGKRMDQSQLASGVRIFENAKSRLVGSFNDKCLVTVLFLCAKVLLRDSRFCSDSLIKHPGISSRCWKLLLSQGSLGPCRFFAESSTITANWQKWHFLLFWSSFRVSS